MKPITEVTYDDIMMEKLLREEYANVEPSVNPGASEVYFTLLEANQSYIEIMKALALQELKQTAFAQTGFWHETGNNNASTGSNQAQPTPTTSSNDKKVSDNKKGFIAKAIDAIIGFFKKIWNGIVGVWKWLVAKFDKYIRFNDSFVKKYSVELSGVQSTKFDGYNFSGLAKTNGDFNITIAIGTKVNLEEAQKELLTQLGVDPTNLKPTAEDFKTFYFGSTQSQEQEFTISKQLEHISHLANDKAAATKAMNDIKKWFTAYEGAFKEYLKGATQTTEDEWKGSVSYGKWAAPIVYMAITQYSKALVARANQARAICIKALKDKEEAAAKNESAYADELTVEELIQEGFTTEVIDELISEGYLSEGWKSVKHKFVTKVGGGMVYPMVKFNQWYFKDDPEVIAKKKAMADKAKETRRRNQEKAAKIAKQEATSPYTLNPTALHQMLFEI